MKLSDTRSNVKPDEPKPQRLIFRAEALRRYEQRRQESVLPRLVSPRTFLFLWIMLGLLVVSGVAAWATPVPVYASGSAVIVETDNYTPDLGVQVLLVVFLPPENLPQLQTGQSVFLDLTQDGERAKLSIVAVEPVIISPESAQQRFGAGVGMAQLIHQPAAAAIARLEPIPTDLPAATYIGSVYHADVQIGSRRVISLLPRVGPFFAD